MELLIKIYIIQQCKKNYWLELAVAESVTVWNLICVSPFFWRCTQADYGFNTQPEMEYRMADSELWNITSNHLETGGNSSWKAKKPSE